MHCAKIRAELREGMDTVHAKNRANLHHSAREVPLSIDLSQAFDMLPRAVMKDAHDPSSTWTM